MKIKTSELTGAALDWAAAKTEGFDIDERWHPNDYPFNPSSDWSQGGPIIERERIDVCYDPGEKLWNAQWFGSDEWTTYYGDTALQAAMRCFVASKLGEEVDIPEELS